MLMPFSSIFKGVSMPARLSLLVLFLLFSVPLSSEPGFSLQSQVEPEVLDLNDSLEVKVRLTYPVGYLPDRTLLRDHLLQAPFKLAHESSFPPIEKNGSLTEEIHYTLEPWKAGSFWLSFYEVSFVSKKGQVTLSAPLNEVTVTGGEEVALPPLASLLPLSQNPQPTLNRATELLLHEMAEEEPLRNARIFHSHQFPWYAVGMFFPLAGLALLAALLVAFLVPRKEQRVIPPPSPREVALEALTRLEQRQLPKAGEYDVYYTKLTEILRRYLTEMHLVPAVGQTTQEFIAWDAEETLNPHQHQLLADILTYADQIKFAKMPSTLKECDTASKEVEEFIKAGS